MEQIWSLLSGYDLQGLREYWRYLNQRLFSRLEQRYAPSVRKLESSLLKLYVVNAHQSGKQDKVLAFFEQLAGELQSHSDFKDWFAFPFVTTPSDNPMFSMYFSKQWQDTLQLSLHNFLSVVLQAMPVPTLLNVEFDARRMKTLQEENTSLKQQLMSSATSNEINRGEARSGTRRNLHSELPPPSSPPDMVYDFSGLASDFDSTNQEKVKNTRRFPLILTSPLVGRKKTTEAAQAKPKVTASASAISSTTAAGVTGTQGKQGKVTEMSTTPSSSEGRKLSMASQMPASSSSSTGPVTTDATRNQVTSKQVPSSQQQGATVVRHATFSASEASSTATSLLTNVSRKSLSAPDGKNVSNSKLLGNKRRSETQLTPISDASTDASAANPLLDSGSDSETPQQLASDADSPFLLLEEDEYTEHSSAASFCRFSLTGQYVASLDVDGIVKVWMWSPQPSTTATVMSRSAFLSLAWASKSDRWLLLGNKTGSIRLFDVKDSKTYREVPVHQDNPANCMRVTDLSTSPSSMQFVCATADYCPFTSNLNNVSGRLLQWDLRTLKLERALQVDSAICNAITCSSYSQSGHMLLTGGADGFIRIYDSNSQKPALKWPGHDTPIHTVQFHGERSVYSMSADGKLCEWNLARIGNLVNTINCGQRDLGKVNSGSCRGRLFALHLDHYLLTYTGRRGSIFKIQDVPSPTRVMELKLHQSPVVTVDWSPSPDTQVCITGSADAKIKISTLLSK
ncbi:unnamed protein product [Lymnaea stagnalis]|uniref:WD repeat-containing protein 91 n=1 Tax=Lymnaea stagnalis TaxID=6523 RepID=A0AAV2H369_LYMST